MERKIHPTFQSRETVMLSGSPGFIDLLPRIE